MDEARGFVAWACNLRAQCGRFTYHIPGEMHGLNVAFAFIDGAQSAIQSGSSLKQTIYL